MNRIDSEAYKLPEGYSVLVRSWSFRDDITRPNDLNGLPRLAGELGFSRADDFLTKKSRWQVFDRPNHEVPNFPEGSTRVSSMLAVYGTAEELTHAVLRSAPEPFPSEEFTKDLAAFTKHYLERPRLLGFPSQEQVKLRSAMIAVAAGIVLGSVADYYTVQSMGDSFINWGMLIGEGTAPLAHGVLSGVAEKRARKSISHPDQYSVGDSAQNILFVEKDHTITVAVQKELYQALGEEGIDLSPEEFLEKIYGQIPRALVERRRVEVAAVQYPKLGPEIVPGNSLPKLIQVSHVLRQVEDYLNLANELKRGLAQ